MLFARGAWEKFYYIFLSHRAFYKQWGPVQPISYYLDTEPGVHPCADSTHSLNVYYNGVEKQAEHLILPDLRSSMLPEVGYGYYSLFSNKFISIPYFIHWQKDNISA
jgi:hypothetical protein